jgi:hypothetical protein
LEKEEQMRESRPDLKGSRQVARILRRALEKGATVEIDGLGTFLPGQREGFRFVEQNRPRIFIAYVEEDLAAARKLYSAFEKQGLRPWLDKKKLMPGQNWPRAIEDAIRTSDFFVACFSRRATSKRGSFHSELRYALACAALVPLDEIFFIPVRFEYCLVPGRIAKDIHYVDLFPDWEGGVRKVLAIVARQQASRRHKLLPLAG